MEQQFLRIAVKVGSNVLTRRDGTLDVTRMSALVDQIAELHKTGVEIILVSSGAVASGRSEVHSARASADYEREFCNTQALPQSKELYDGNAGKWGHTYCQRKRYNLCK